MVGRRPSEKTIRLLIEAVDDLAFSLAVARWLGFRVTRRTGRRVIAVDGKTTRDARVRDTTAPHLLAALEHTSGVVLGQLQVDGNSNEISSSAPLLDGIKIAGTVVTADALHTQTGHVEYFDMRLG